MLFQPKRNGGWLAKCAIWLALLLGFSGVGWGQDGYLLTVAKPEYGTVVGFVQRNEKASTYSTKDDYLIDCGVSAKKCVALAPGGNQIKLYAIPEDDYFFTGWDGNIYLENKTYNQKEIQANTKIILIAKPKEGYHFIGWGGACASNANTCEVTMNASKNVSAHFGSSLLSLAVLKKDRKVNGGGITGPFGIKKKLTSKR